MHAVVEEKYPFTMMDQYVWCFILQTDEGTEVAMS